MVYCIVPRGLTAPQHRRLRRQLADEPRVEVIVERRVDDRRGPLDRRGHDSVVVPVPQLERRKVRSRSGRRCGERRAAQRPLRGHGLPRSMRRAVDRVRFVELVAPADLTVEDVEVARTVTRIQSGDVDAFADLYMRYFNPVYGYMRLALRTGDEAEDATQQVFVNVLEALPRYERRGPPFRAWLFRIARNLAIDRLRERGRLELEEPGRLDLLAEPSRADLQSLDWLSDHDVLAFIERLPLAQRQVLVLRYMLDLSTAEIADVLDRSQAAVRQLQSRALRRLEEQLGALGVAARPQREARPMRLALSQLTTTRARFEHGFSIAVGF
jgi:RNA polymerase sigma-70 factor (ECF subfamily)